MAVLGPLESTEQQPPGTEKVISGLLTQASLQHHIYSDIHIDIVRINYIVGAFARFLAKNIHPQR